jgi:hypothetical protein
LVGLDASLIGDDPPLVRKNLPLVRYGCRAGHLALLLVVGFSSG